MAARFVRDEEAAGSNPATPTKALPGQRALDLLSTGMRGPLMSDLGAEREPILVGDPPNRRGHPARERRRAHPFAPIIRRELQEAALTT